MVYVENSKLYHIMRISNLIGHLFLSEVSTEGVKPFRLEYIFNEPTAILEVSVSIVEPGGTRVLVQGGACVLKLRSAAAAQSSGRCARYFYIVRRLSYPLTHAFLSILVAPRISITPYSVAIDRRSSRRSALGSCSCS